MIKPRRKSSRPHKILVPANEGTGTIMLSASKDRIVLAHRSSTGRSTSICELNAERALALQFALHTALKHIEGDGS